VVERAQAGDAVARTIWDEAISAIAQAVVLLHATVDPDVVVIGGGLSMAGSTLFAPLRDACQRLGAAPELEIVGAELGDAAGWRGAAILAWDWIDDALGHD
jgi:glucokinase